MEKNNYNYNEETAAVVNGIKNFSGKENNIFETKSLEEVEFNYENEVLQKLPLYYDEFHFASYE